MNTKEYETAAQIFDIHFNGKTNISTSILATYGMLTNDIAYEITHNEAETVFSITFVHYKNGETNWLRFMQQVITLTDSYHPYQSALDHIAYLKNIIKITGGELYND